MSALPFAVTPIRASPGRVHVHNANGTSGFLVAPPETGIADPAPYAIHLPSGLNRTGGLAPLGTRVRWPHVSRSTSCSLPLSTHAIEPSRPGRRAVAQRGAALGAGCAAPPLLLNQSNQAAAAAPRTTSTEAPMRPRRTRRRCLPAVPHSNRDSGDRAY